MILHLLLLLYCPLPISIQFFPPSRTLEFCTHRSNGQSSGRQSLSPPLSSPIEPNGQCKGCTVYSKSVELSINVDIQTYIIMHIGYNQNYNAYHSFHLLLVVNVYSFILIITIEICYVRYNLISYMIWWCDITE